MTLKSNDLLTSMNVSVLRCMSILLYVQDWQVFGEHIKHYDGQNNINNVLNYQLKSLKSIFDAKVNGAHYSRPEFSGDNVRMTCPKHVRDMSLTMSESLPLNSEKDQGRSFQACPIRSKLLLLIGYD